MTTSEKHQPVPSATVRLRYLDGVKSCKICWSPDRVIEVADEAPDQGLFVEEIVWTADDSVMVSRAAMPDFLGLDSQGQRGWIGAIWAKKLEGSLGVSTVGRMMDPAERVKLGEKYGRALVKFWLAHWQWVIGSALALAALLLRK
jgi:hypothetical protein